MTHKDALTRAVALTDDILEVLDDQNLERLIELEAQREPAIRQAFEQSIQQVDSIKAIHLQSLNQQVIEKLMKLKDSIQQEKQHISHGVKVAQAYQLNQA